MHQEFLIDAVSVAASILAKTTVNPLKVDQTSLLVVNGLNRVFLICVPEG